MLKLQYFGHLMRRTDSLEKTLMWERLKAGGEDDKRLMTRWQEETRRWHRGQDGWMATLTWWTWVWVGSRSWWWTGRPGVLQSMGTQRVGHNWVTEQWQQQRCLRNIINWRVSWFQLIMLTVFFSLTNRCPDYASKWPYNIGKWREGRWRFQQERALF